MRFLAAFLGVLAALGILYAAAARLVDPHSDDRPEADLIRNDALMRTLAEGTLREPGLLAPVRKYPLAALVKKYKATFTIEYASDTVRALRLAARPGSQPLPMMEFEPDG